MAAMTAAHEESKLELVAEVLSRCGTVEVKAWGTSMLPSVWPGDLLTIQKVAPQEIIPGDIVIILRDNRFLIHRLVKRVHSHEGVSWVTRGDAMPQNDPPATAQELLGRVVAIRRGDSNFVPSRRFSPLRSALGWALCRSSRFRSLYLRMHTLPPSFERSPCEEVR